MIKVDAIGLGALSASGERRQDSNNYSNTINTDKTEKNYQHKNEFEIEIDQAITDPKKLDVLKISKIMGEINIEFHRIRVKRYEATFRKEFELITDDISISRKKCFNIYFLELSVRYNYCF